MPYVRSAHRISFDGQVEFLLKKARRANRMRQSDSDIRDLVFQCAVFQTSAASETYIRLLVESWIQKMRSKGGGTVAPSSARAFIALKRLEKAFYKYQYLRDEKFLYDHIASEVELWPFLQGGTQLPLYFDGRAIHDGVTYPSGKNIKRLFARTGIDNMIGRISGNLGRDAEVLIDSFQSVRTALAHASPPPLTIVDVEKLLGDSKSLVGAIDRIFFSHVLRHGGVGCWTT